VKVPYSRESGKTSYVEAYVLLTPLNSVHACFLNGCAVANFSNPQSPNVDSNSPFRALTQANPRFLKGGSTLMLLQKNGQEWYFSKTGQLLAVKDGPQVTLYERGAEGQMTRLVSLVGSRLAGEIKLEYSDGKLQKAIGRSLAYPSSRVVAVSYSYDNAGRLAGVSTDEGTVGYRYQGTKVSAVTWQDMNSDSHPEVLREYQYDARGRVMSEKNGSSEIVHTISAEFDGLVASSRLTQGKTDASVSGPEVHYDQKMRPVKAVAADGNTTQWSYPESGGVSVTVTGKDGESMTVLEAPDGKSLTIKQNGSIWATAYYDDAGNLIDLSEFGQVVLHQDWRADGQLSRVFSGGQGRSLKYGENGLLSSVMLHPAGAGERPTEWQETRVDAFGRPIEIKDFTGLHVGLTYDESGGLSSVHQPSPDGKNRGFEISRNDKGLVKAVTSSWGDVIYSYGVKDKKKNEGKDVFLDSVVTTRGKRSASIKLDDGHVREVTGFDGSRTSFEYHKGSLDGLLSSVVCADGLNIVYGYNNERLLSEVKVGGKRKVKLEYDNQGRLVSYALEPISQ